MPTPPNVVAGVVVAGGSGERLGADVPKGFVDVGGGSLLARAVTGLRAGGIGDLVVVVPAGWEDRARAELGSDVAVAAGGPTRTASVAAGLAAVGPEATVVAVHDAARAFVPPDVVRAALDAVVTVAGMEAATEAGEGDVVAAAPGLPVGDTLKRVATDATVVDTFDRTGLVGIQTPQVFHRTVLERAHERAARVGAAATDDLALVEGLVTDGVVSGRVVVTPGSPLALKVTHPSDLVLAEALARRLDTTTEREVGRRVESGASS